LSPKSKRVSELEDAVDNTLGGSFQFWVHSAALLCSVSQGKITGETDDVLLSFIPGRIEKPASPV
jgi:hypothetical protein